MISIYFARLVMVAKGPILYLSCVTLYLCIIFFGGTYVVIFVYILVINVIECGETTMYIDDISLM